MAAVVADGLVTGVGVGAGGEGTFTSSGFSKRVELFKKNSSEDDRRLPIGVGTGAGDRGGEGDSSMTTGMGSAAADVNGSGLGDFAFASTVIDAVGTGFFGLITGLATVEPSPFIFPLSSAIFASC